MVNITSSNKWVTVTNWDWKTRRIFFIASDEAAQEIRKRFPDRVRSVRSIQNGYEVGFRHDWDRNRRWSEARTYLEAYNQSQ